ncbi:hypothetical protein PIROE2DRAFT_6530 [Piromyces sp. E2]|nr:hypothetical protein PIROE2DRAFT_6530 [Piromyces sp. E2]|eukprot:OUM66292.1 hypothetical protein PIROE2DRAFT_6530 [Piromyces sp. E2]
MNQPFITLNNGFKIPQFGLGVFFIYDEEDCRKTCLEAFKMGYRHIDTDHGTHNEKGIGKAIKESGIPREEIAITSKIWVSEYGKDKTMKAIDGLLERLGTTYVDLVLLNQPGPNYIEAWKDLEKAVELGKVKAIGFANFDEYDIEELLENVTIKPAVCQIECHPHKTNKEIRKILEENNINLESWFPIGHSDRKLVNEPLLQEIAKKYNKSPIQVILRWHVQNGFLVFPKSTKLNHIKENFNIFDFELTPEEMEKIEGLNQAEYDF